MRIVPQIRAAWPGTRIPVRGDSGFCRDEIMAWCEEEGIDYVFGLARNSRPSRRIAKAELLPGQRGDDPRFVVTSLPGNRVDARCLYEDVCCGRGDMEIRVNEQQLWLFADRNSSATMRANQLRLYFSAFAGILVTILRRVGLRGTDLATARIDTIRSRLFKLAGRIRVTVRRVWLSFASVFPLKDAFEQALANLRAAPVRAPPG